MLGCCSEHGPHSDIACVAWQELAVREAKDMYEDPAVRFMYLLSRLGNVAKHDWGRLGRLVA